MSKNFDFMKTWKEEHSEDYIEKGKHQDLKPNKSFSESPISSSKRGQGRPKGDPAVTRSLRIKTDINTRLIEEHVRTGLSFNELANRAFDAYLQK